MQIAENLSTLPSDYSSLKRGNILKRGYEYLPCFFCSAPNIDTVDCTSTSHTALSVEWSQATATRDACDRDGGAVDITTYEVNVLQHVQNGNAISTVSFNEMEYPRDVDISQLETSVTGLGKSTCTNHIKHFPHPLVHTQMKVSIRGI